LQKGFPEPFTKNFKRETETKNVQICRKLISSNLYVLFCVFLLEQQTSLIAEMFDAFLQAFFGAAGVFGKAGETEKFRRTAVDHLLVDADFVIRQLPSAFFAARLYGVVVHMEILYFLFV
jgi:hypothetical protein